MIRRCRSQTNLTVTTVKNWTVEFVYNIYIASQSLKDCELAIVNLLN